MTVPIPLHTGPDYVAAAPYLLGFHPADGDLVVISGINGRLCGISHATAAYTAIDEVIERLATEGFTSAHLIGYGTSPEVDNAFNIAEIVCNHHDISLQRVIQVNDGRYHNRHDPHDPDNGQLVTNNTRVAAELVARGINAMPDRNAVTALLAPASETARSKVDMALNALARPGMRAPAADALVGRHMHAGTLPGPIQCGQILTSLRDSHREAAAFALTETDPERALPVWLYVCRHAPQSHLGEPAAQVAYAAFRSGSAALAHDAIGLALIAQPDSRLYDLIAMAVNTADPSTFPPMGSLLTALTDPVALAAGGRPANGGTPVPPSTNGTAPDDPEPTQGYRHGR